MSVPGILLVTMRKLRYVSRIVLAFCKCVYMLFGRIKRVLVLEMKCHKLVVRWCLEHVTIVRSMGVKE